MYKGASRFGQGLRQRGVKPTHVGVLKGRPTRPEAQKAAPKGGLSARLDAGAAARKRRDWFAYLDACSHTGSKAYGVPEEIVRESQAARGRK